mgnify:FL=1
MSPTANENNKKQNLGNNLPEEKEKRILWELSEYARSRVSVSEQEKQDALSHVFDRIDDMQDQEEETRSLNTNLKADKSTSVTPLFKYVAAAAILLLSIGTAYMLTNQTYSTAPGQYKQITLSDNTQIQLNAGSVLKVPRYFGWLSRTVSLEGEAFFNVSTTGKRFNVTTSNASVRVLGTQFNLRSRTTGDSIQTVVAVLEGRVGFRHRSSSQELNLSKGESAIAYQERLVTGEVDVREASSWLSGDFGFYDQSLPAIFNEIERRFAIIIDYDASELYNQRLSAFYSNPEDAETIIQDICLAKGLTYRPVNNGFEIVKEE